MRTFIQRSSLKVLALLLAIGLWYYVTSDVATTILKIPIEINNKSALFLITDYPETVDVKVRGPEFIVNNLITSPPSFHIAIKDILDNSSDSLIINLKKEDLKITPSVEIISIDPQKIEIKLDQLINKTVKIETPKEGNLSKGIILQELSISPNQVVIRGPAKYLENISKIDTYPLDLTQIEGNASTTKELKTPNKFITLGIDQVELKWSVKTSESK